MQIKVIEGVSADDVSDFDLFVRLKRVDPKRFKKLMSIARDVVAAHDDPIGERADLSQPEIYA